MRERTLSWCALLLALALSITDSFAFRLSSSSPSSWNGGRSAARMIMKAADNNNPASSRRDLLHKGALLFGARLMLQNPIFIKPSLAADGVAADITDKAYFDISIGGKPAGRFVFGLYGKEAPVTVSNFLKVLEGKAQGASYDYSTVFRVEKGVCVDLGRITGGGGKKLQKNINESGVMRISSANAAAWTQNDESNSLKHQAPYLLTAVKGGGTYEFSITLAPNAQLDKDHVVFGQLLEGQGVIEQILKVPVSTDDPINSKKIFSSAGKKFDPRARIIYLNKPLQKIVVKDTGRFS